MDSNTPEFVFLLAPCYYLYTRLSFQIREPIKPVRYCKIIDKAKKVREGSLICPDNDFTMEAI